MEAMLAKMPSAKFARWLAFGDLCPWGGDADNLRAGKIAAAVVNWAGQTLKPGAPRAKPSDFFSLPNLEVPEPTESPDPLAELEALAESQKGNA